MSGTVQDPTGPSDPTPQGRVDGAAAETSSPQGYWRLMLLASLAVNLLFAGAAVGSLWIAKHPRPVSSSASGTPELAMTGFIRTLSKERAKELRRLIKQQGRPDIEPLMAASRQARRDAAQALAAEPFDGTQLKQAFDKIDTAEAATKAAIRSNLIAVAGQLSPTERLTLAERWKARRPHMFEDVQKRPRREKPAENDRAP